jgi:MEMO1 family protein
MQESSEPTTTPLPALRCAIELIPVNSNGRMLVALRDRADPAGTTVYLDEIGRRVASLLDGVRSARSVCAAFALRSPERLHEGDVLDLVAALDQANLLKSERHRQRQAELLAEFRATVERPAVHAGGAYPDRPDRLRSFVDRWYGHADGPGGPPGPPSAAPARALIAPHIDLHRGGATYAWTYRALAETQPVDTYLLLGTCHTSMSTPLAATRKRYATPIGPAEVDHDLLDSLEAVYPGDLYADELSHRAEHSLEFQAVYLRALGLVGDGAGRIVPLLCGSLHEWVEPGQSPREVALVATVVEALRSALAAAPGRVCVVAGADLAHVGPQFGDRARVSAAVAARVGRADLEMLDIICSGDAEAFYRQVMLDHDGRRICGLAPIYYLLALLGPTTGRCLKYSQWIDPAGRGAVTYAGVVFEGESMVVTDRCRGR